MSEEATCTDCGSSLEIGFMPDAAYGATIQAVWHKGNPEGNTFFGIDVSSRDGRGGLNVDERQMRFITAYRCVGCGLLKIYANSSVKRTAG